MKLDIRNSRVFVPGNGLIAIRDGAGTRITCRTGAFWITQEGHIRDIVLKPGESFVIEAPGRTVVTSLTDGELAIEEPHAARRRADSPKRRTIPPRAMPAAA